MVTDCLLPAAAGGCGQLRQIVGTHLSLSVLLDLLQAHSMLPAWVIGEKESASPSILVLAFLGAVLEKCAVMMPVAPTPTEMT